MGREELIEKMLDAFDDADERWTKTRPVESMAAALDVAVGELLGDSSIYEINCSGALNVKVSRAWADADYERITAFLQSRRSRYLKPKSDPAVEAVRKLFSMEERGTVRVIDVAPEEIVAAVRNADKGAK